MALRPELAEYLGAGPRRPPGSCSLPAPNPRSLPLEKRGSGKARKKGPNEPPEERSWLGVRINDDEEIAAFLRLRDGGSLCLGSGFSTEEEAARCRDLAAICLDGGCVRKPTPTLVSTLLLLFASTTWQYKASLRIVFSPSLQGGHHELPL